MQVIFCRRNNAGSWALRAVLRSSWSHCGIVTPQGMVIHAAAFHGVIRQPLTEFADGVSHFAVRDIALPDDAAAIQWALSQVGKPYDWLGALGIAANTRQWQEPDAWFCSELVEAAAAAGGRQRFIHDAWRVTPQSSWMVA